MRELSIIFSDMHLSGVTCAGHDRLRLFKRIVENYIRQFRPKYEDNIHN